MISSLRRVYALVSSRAPGNVFSDLCHTAEGKVRKHFCEAMHESRSCRVQKTAQLCAAVGPFLRTAQVFTGLAILDPEKLLVIRGLALHTLRDG